MKPFFQWAAHPLPAVLTVFVSAISTVAAIAAPLSDTEAREIVQRAIGQSSSHQFRTGELTLNPAQPGLQRDVDFLVSLGLITVTDIPKPGQIFTRTVRMELTEKGKVAVTKTAPDTYRIPLGTRTVIRIVRNVDYDATVRAGEELRLVLGIFEFKPTPIGREVAAKQNRPLPKEYKFRALLKANPFNDSFSFASFDWGYTDRDTWETDHIR